MATKPRLASISMTFGKKVSKNYNTYEAVITEQWTIPDEDFTQTDIELFRVGIGARLKKAVNEELGIKFEENPA